MNTRKKSDTYDLIQALLVALEGSLDVSAAMLTLCQAHAKFLLGEREFSPTDRDTLIAARPIWEEKLAAIPDVHQLIADVRRTQHRKRF